ncbi:hypothetical protein LTR36_000555 [Oleoguttula mirabilis]|uniref:F-box domain-containing protein n=1 Tax=Oleoguttula mirabilis TaxID=1507867 RepID=A0AAV9JQ97_9PEZI|nr:hypothetical protein LTR36_000555 [Oleoguttula mirabilis]
MVFHLPPKRKPGAKASITHLADETLLDILAYGLSTPDILRFRLSHPSFTPACTTLLARRLHCLYIHPCTSSLRAAVNICNHPVLGQEIDEVVLLGKVLWREFERTWPDYRILDSDPVKQQDCNLHRPWPFTFPKAKGETDSIHDLVKELAVQDGNTTYHFDVAYGPLISALAKLTCLKKISFAEQVDKPGWNATSQGVMDAHAKKVGIPPEPEAKFKYTGNLTSGFPSQVAKRRSDANVLLDLLYSRELHFTELAITTELPYVASYAVKATSKTSPQPQMKLTNLISLELHLDHGWQGTKWHYFCRGMVQQDSHPRLQNLRLVWRPNAAVKSARDDRTLSYLLEGERIPYGRRTLSFPELKKLEIVSFSPKGHRRPARPVCHLYDLQAFIERHANTLEEVSVIEALVQCEKLQQVTWTVNRFVHDERCKRKDGEPTTGCKLQCGVYSNASVGLGGLADVEALVEELGVELDAEGKAWDFGEYVMRRQQERKRIEDEAEEVS